MLMYVVDKKGKGELKPDFHFIDYISMKPKLSNKIVKKRLKRDNSTESEYKG